VKILLKIIYKTLKYKFINIILIVFGDRVSAGRRMKYRPHPQTSFGGTFTSIPIPTGKNYPTSDPQTGQSSRGSPFTDEIDIPSCMWHSHAEFKVNEFDVH
jgi:hypothetical protein